MALMRDGKKIIISNVAREARESSFAILAEYRSLDANSMNLLRKLARELGISLKVVPNRLARLAVKGTNFECLANTFKGPLILALSKEDPGAASRLFKKFKKNHDALMIKSLAISNEVFGSEKLDYFAALPTKKEAISMLRSVLKAPVSSLARTINDIPSQLLRVIDAVRGSK